MRSLGMGPPFSLSFLRVLFSSFFFSTTFLVVHTFPSYIDMYCVAAALFVVIYFGSFPSVRLALA
jgi:hypothetical protein